MDSIVMIGQTSRGLVRPDNQDHILLGRLVLNRGRAALRVGLDSDLMSGWGLLAAAADGVGGEAGGALASRMALTTLDSEFQRQNPTDLIKNIGRAVEAANERILAEAEQRPELANMGTTLAGVVLTWKGFYVFHSGDSRVYRFRSGFLKPLTEDDTVAALALKSGLTTLEESRVAPTRHMLTNCVGSREYRLTFRPGPEFRDGDIILISSDGLHDLVSHENLERIIGSGRDLDSMLDELFEAAEQGGGDDNISAILVQALA
ncbi:MAG: protein phosphatase 2C domain-containing protein [Pseudomonadota bacterium]